VTVEVWPQTGQRVEVQILGAGVQMFAVVDDARPPDQLHLREPVALHGRPVTTAVPGSQLLLRWPTAAGLHELPAVLAGFPAHRLPLWKLVPLTVPVVEQRRAFLRSPDALDGDLSADTGRWRIIVVDISEAGARCVLDRHASLTVGGSVWLRVNVSGLLIALDATLLAVDPIDDERAAARLHFQPPKRIADLLRRRAFEQDRRARVMARTMERA
jgi:hypothetical protein